MDPDGKWISTRAVLLAAAGQNCWPPAGSYMAATGQDLMAADTGCSLLRSAPPRRRRRGLPAFVAGSSCCRRGPHSSVGAFGEDRQWSQTGVAAGGRLCGPVLAVRCCGGRDLWSTVAAVGAATTTRHAIGTVCAAPGRCHSCAAAGVSGTGSADASIAALR